MGVKNFNLPDPGEGLVEAEVVSWKVKPGDAVQVNQVVVEIETAKSLVELPIAWEGTVKDLLVDEGTTVEVGTPILSIEVEGAADDAPSGGDPTTAGRVASPSGERIEASEDAEEKVANLVGYGPSAGSTKRRARKRPQTAGRVASPPGERIEASGSGSAATGGSLGSAATGGPTPQTIQASPQAPTPARPSQSAPQAPQSQPGASAPQSPQPAPRASALTPAGTQLAGRVDRSASGGRIEASQAGSSGVRPLAKPPVRKFAKDNGVDLALVAPTREDGVISRADVEAYLERAGAPEPAVAMPTSSGERETRVPIKGVRKMTAQAMTGSAFTAPHVTEFVAVDMTRTMELVERLKTDREFRDVKVTPLLVLARALVIAVHRNPGINAAWDEAAQEIVLKHYVNLGIAAATPRGLVVPNIKDADRMSMRELADAMGALVGTAREGRTQPAEMAGGTITITNVGVFGVDTGTPIINPGESAIVCFGQVRKMPWVVTDAQGNDQIVPRQVTQLGVSFDHRLVDGDLGSRFLADIATLLEDPAKALVWG